MTVVINGTTGISNDGGYTGDGVVFADTTPANTLVTTTGGNVGIGTSSPSAKLDVNGAVLVRGLANKNTSTAGTGYTYFDIGTDSDGAVRSNIVAAFSGTSSTLEFGTSTSGTRAERMRIDPSGNVGIGTSSPVKSLQVNGAIIARGGAPGANNANNNGFAFHGNSGDLDGGLYSLADGMVNIFTNNSEVARFDSDRARFGSSAVNASRFATVNIVSARSGDDWNNRQLLVEDTAGGAGSPAIGFHAPANSAATVFKMYGPTAAFECRNAGDSGFVAILASAFNVSSDYRIKTDVVEFGSVLSNVLALRPVNYEKDGITGREYGLIAHEAAEHFPDLVQGEKDGMRSDGTMELQTVSYTGLTSVLVKAIQEQQAIITALTARVEALEGTQP